MPRIDLPDSQWADVREDLGKAPRRLAKEIGAAQAALASLPSFAAVRNAARAAGEDGVESAAADLSTQIAPDDIPAMMPLMDRMREAQVLALVTAWSYGPDVTASALDEIPEDAFDILVAEAEKRTTAAQGATKAELLDPTPPPAVSNV